MIEKGINRTPQFGHLSKREAVLTPEAMPEEVLTYFSNRGLQRQFAFLDQELQIVLFRNLYFPLTCLAEDVFHTLECDRDGGKIFRNANPTHSFGPRNRSEEHTSELQSLRH